MADMTRHAGRVRMSIRVYRVVPATGDEVPVRERREFRGSIPAASLPGLRRGVSGFPGCQCGGCVPREHAHGGRAESVAVRGFGREWWG
jgi:hypothetical protein